VRDSLSGRSDPNLIPTAGANDPETSDATTFGVWIAVFNPNPVEVVTYELTMTVRQPRAAVRRPVGLRRGRGGPAR